ncbi:MAG: GNAT family N-acetyltransferase [Dongiaceae bacterium]
MKEADPSVACRGATPADAGAITQLFGANGACGGCWCMHWRVEKGGATWAACKGEPNRRAFLRLLKQGRAQGALAFAEDRPVGWCNFGLREEFPRLARSRVLGYTATPKTWSINCFFIAPGWRRRGVAGALLEAAIDAAFARGATALEAYPTPQRPGQKLAAAFAWTGTRSLFAKAGFRPSADNERVWLKGRSAV